MKMVRSVAPFALGALVFGLAACQPPAPAPAEKTESAADMAAKVAAANQATFEKFMDEVFSQGKVDAIDDMLTTDFVEHQPMPPGMPVGPAGLKQFVMKVRSAFPDLSVKTEQIVASGDMVAARTTWSGTFTKDFMGMKPTGKMENWEAYDIVRMKDGKATEHWGLDNLAEVLMPMPMPKKKK